MSRPWLAQLPFLVVELKRLHTFDILAGKEASKKKGEEEKEEELQVSLPCNAWAKCAGNGDSASFQTELKMYACWVTCGTYANAGVFAECLQAN